MTVSDEWVDSDNAFELGPDFFEHAVINVGDRVIREATGTLRRRDGVSVVEQYAQPSPRVDRDVDDALKATGPGWQALVNQVLREAKL